jgi:predicted NBD/HSP70 family sugar kinase
MVADVARGDHGGRSGAAKRRTGFEGRRKALPADARRQNRSLLLRALFHAGPMSRADLARASGLTPTTVSNVIGELVSEGMIEEAGRTLSGSVGKPATLVSVVADARHVVCLDLSCAGEIRGAVVDLARKVVARRSVRRREASGAALIGQRVATTAIEIAGELASQTDRPLLGIGVATPGVVDTDGVVVRAAHLGLDHVTLGPQLTAALGLPVRVANDAHAAALGELAFVTSDYGNVLLVRIAEGIGAGLVINHQLFTGTAHAAGEIGHVVVNPRGALCACGKRGCLETVVATPLTTARAAGDVDRKVIAAAGRHLGAALAHLVSALNIDTVVLSGSDEVLGETFRTAASEVIRKRTLDDLGGSVELRPSNFGDDDALLGAAVLILDQELGVA